MKTYNKIKETGCMVIVLLLFCLGQVFAAECGDVNSDGRIVIVDALLIAQYYVGLNPSNFDSTVADVNGENGINIVDALLIAQYYVGLINELTGCSQTPDPTNTPATSTVTFQAEDADFSNAEVETEHSGYTGSGYVNTDNVAGPYIEWAFNASIAGNADCVFTYAVNDDSRSMELTVNGSNAVSSLDFPDTGGWNSWSTVSATVSLLSGRNTVRITALDSEGAPNLDKMDVTFNGAISTPEPTPTPEILSEIYVSPNGQAGAAGTQSDPLNLESAIIQIANGGTIWMLNGTYYFSSSIIIAEGNDGKNLYAQNSGSAIIDFSAMSFSSSNRGVILAGANWHVRGITIQKAGDNGMLLAGDNNTIEDCLFRQNQDTGLQLSRYNTDYDSISEWPSNNTIINCISKDNYDSDNGEDADGFAPKLTSGTGNVFRDCKALYNTDDGVDCYTKSSTGAIGAVRFERCEASNNGATSTGQSTGNSDGNGFKLGDDTAAVQHVLIDCVANNNKKHGYTGNGNPGPITLTNCTGSGNGGKLFDRL